MSRRARARIDKRQVAEALFRTGPEDDPDGEGDTPDADDATTLTTVSGEKIGLRKPWQWPTQGRDGVAR